jgi:uracil phosphoribosyltransferase
MSVQVHRLKENSSKQNTNEIMIISISRSGSIMVHCISKKMMPRYWDVAIYIFQREHETATVAK